MIARALVAIAIAGALAGRAYAVPPHVAPGTVPTGPVEAEPPRIELLTFGTGEVIFEKYGHAALCLIYNNPAYEPLCFNYGVTDFDDMVAMGWNFLRTNQQFWVELDPLAGMLDFYRWEDRTIDSQMLPLTAPEARAIEAALWTTTEDAHKFYIYDHFFNNCTTRLRDIIDASTGGKLRAISGAPFPMTFRQIGYRGMAEFPEVPAIGDFVFGRMLDDRPTYWQAMFHPDVLRDQVTAAFGVAPSRLHTRTGPPFPTTGDSGRWATILAALVFGLPLVLARWCRRFERTALAWATFELAFWGVLIWSIAIISSIPMLRWNEAVLVMVPFDIVLPWLSAARRRGYARVRVVMILAISLLCAIGVLHQPLWIPAVTAFLPLAALAL